MRKIFSILVTLMMVAGTFVSCNMPTNTDTGSSTGTDTVVSSTTLNEFINNTFEEVDWSDPTKRAYSGKVKGTNDYVLIPTNAAVPNNFSKVDDYYSFGDAKLFKREVNGCEEMNIYLYAYDLYYFSTVNKGPRTIGMSDYMCSRYFNDDDSINEYITIGNKTINITR
ncbi:MAG: hypothetical protein IIT46_07225 [Lachnospiraceae bacterium]|nr:hypothetical protein [Lachnospiraceae bacterium]